MRTGSSATLAMALVIVLTTSVWAGIFLLTGGNLTGSSTLAAGSESYTINGLTCAAIAGTPEKVTAVVSELTANSRFKAATNGSRFVLGNYENITARSQTVGGKILSGPTQNGSVIGGAVVHFPDVTEFVFYSYGPSTTCVRESGDYTWMDVQVPIQNAAYNVTGMQITVGRGPV